MKLHSYLYCCIWLFLALITSCSKSEDSPKESLPPITIPNEMLTISSSWELNSKTITFTATVPWVVEAPYDWLQVSPTNGEAGNISLVLEMEANTIAKDRSAIVSIKAGGQIYKINVKQKAAPATFSISPENSSVTSEAGTVDVTIVSNSDWSVSNTSEWVNLSAESGKGNQIITIGYLANDGPDSRNAVITFTAGNQSLTLTLTQDGKTSDPTLSIDKTTVDVESASSSFIVNVSSNSDWSTSGAPSWVTLSPSQGKGDKIVTVTYQSNESYVKRSAVIIFTGAGKSHTLTITQQAKSFEPILSIDKVSVNTEATSGSFIMNVSSNSDWSTSGVPSWVTLSPAQGKGDKVITVTYQANNNTDPRSAVITFTAGDQSQTLTLTQKGKTPDPTLAIDKTLANVEASSGSFIMNVSSNSDWGTSGVPSWVTLSPAQGKGDKVVTVTYQANSNTESRSTVITFTAGKLSHTLTLTQKGKTPDPTLTIDKTSVNVEASSDYFTMNVSSNSDWSTSGVPSWITLTPAQGNGNKMVKVNYQANGSTELRSATITFLTGNIRRTLTITQAGRIEDDKIELSRYAISAGALSANVSLSVTANVAWYVSNVPGWLSVSPGSGTQNGMVSISWETNTQVAERSATLRFTAGSSYKEVVVTQAGQYILTIETTALQFKSAESSQAITFYANGAWNISDDQDWLSLSASSGYEGNQYVTVYAARHQGNAVRNGIVTITMGTGANQISKQIKVTQTVQPTLTVASTQLKAPFQTSSYTVALTSNTGWSAVSDKAWCTVSPSSGSGNGSIKLSVERNSQNQSRTAVVTLKAGSQAAGYVSKTITVTQNANSDFSITDWGDNGDHGGAAQ